MECETLTPERQLQAALDELDASARHAKAIPALVSKVVSLWSAAFPEKSESPLWWEGQKRVADLAPKISVQCWRAAFQLAELICEPGWRAKVKLCCHLERQHLCYELASRDQFWVFFRDVIHKCEADLGWALEQVRSLADVDRRRFLFAYVDAEFCHAR